MPLITPKIVNASKRLLDFEVSKELNFSKRTREEVSEDDSGRLF
jgi:hypothetical protein